MTAFDAIDMAHTMLSRAVVFKNPETEHEAMLELEGIITTTHSLVESAGTDHGGNGELRSSQVIAAIVAMYVMFRLPHLNER